MESLSNQIAVASQTEAESNDEDSTMEDVANTTDTPLTMSFPPSDTQDASEGSTRASTPTDNRVEDAPAGMHSLKSFE